ncbi:MAG: glycoside hydrolase family 16 protein [Myxococcales bacterium]|nr:glycoside hydrolase family 16 protein [Myxococcales bacterium]
MRAYLAVFVGGFLGCSGSSEGPVEPTDDAGEEVSADTGTPSLDSAPETLIADAATDTSKEAAPVDAATDTGGPTLPGWKLVWNDEFDGPDGAAVDPKKWNHDVGGGGFGNAEREYYTDGTANAVQRAGELVITARKEGGKTCWYGPCTHTSARLKTKGLAAFTYGRVAARIKIPRGQGIWPAFWMLGDDIDKNAWPACGEIDVLENIGKEPTTIHGTIHGPGYSGGAGIGSAKSSTTPFADAFHEYAVEWEKDVIRFYVDDALYATRTPSELPKGTKWVYDHPFFLILNLAVGGGWPGDPDGTTVFPQELRVDWVRVYQR